MEDKVSIIIPAYNAEPYISRAMDSALNQSYGNVEVVAVDDGSADGTWQLLQNYAEKDERVVALKKENGGVSSARNLALKKAGGSFCLFLDADDWLEEDAVAFLADILDRNPGKLPASSYYDVKPSDGGEKRFRKKPAGEERVLDKEESMINVASHDYDLTSSCFKLYDLGIIRREGLRFDEDISYCEDGLFVMRYLNCCAGLAYSPEPKWDILDRGDSATSRAFSPKLLTAVAATERMLDCIPDCPAVRDSVMMNVASKIELIENWALADKNNAVYVRNLREQLRSYGGFMRETRRSLRQRLKYFYYAYVPVPLLRLFVTARNRRLGKHEH